MEETFCLPKNILRDLTKMKVNGNLHVLIL